MHDVMPKVVAIAVSTVITMLITLLQMLFLLFIVISFLVCVKFRATTPAAALFALELCVLCVLCVRYKDFFCFARGERKERRVYCLSYFTLALEGRKLRYDKRAQRVSIHPLPPVGYSPCLRGRRGSLEEAVNLLLYPLRVALPQCDAGQGDSVSSSNQLSP